MTMTNSGIVNPNTLSTVDEPDLHGEHRAAHAADHAAEHDGHHLVPERGHAQHLGRVLGVVHGGEAAAEPGSVDGQRHADRERGDDETQVEEHVLEVADPLRVGGQRDDGALPAVDVHVDARIGGEQERHGQREQREDLAAQRPEAKRDRADRESEQTAEQTADRNAPQEADIVAPGQHRHRVGTDPDVGALTEAEVAGVTRQQVPAGRLGDPEQHRVVSTML